jgi:hypothetical protein
MTKRDAIAMATILAEQMPGGDHVVTRERLAPSTWRRGGSYRYRVRPVGQADEPDEAIVYLARDERGRV